MKKNLHWMRLDNAALIYPAARRKNWTNVYRMSVYVSENVDSDMLDIAIRHVIKRFPSVAVRIRAGFFWYYFEEVPFPPLSVSEEEHRINRITWKELKKCSIRVLYYRNRISVEFFHSVTDGTGAMLFIKNLVAEYLRLKYRADIPSGDGIVDLSCPPSSEELEDSFGKYATDYSINDDGRNCYRLKGIRETDRRLNIITGIVDESELYKLAKSYGATVTVFLSSLMMKSFLEIQNRENRKIKKPVGVLIPVNLRKLFGSSTVRNFTNYIVPQVDPNLGNYSLEELVGIVTNNIALKNNTKYFTGKFSYNVNSARQPVLRVMPLFVKNAAMKLVYNNIGENRDCICLSNLGRVTIPNEMKKYVERVDFILGAQADCPVSCSVASYGGKANINIARTIKEPTLEREFFTSLRKLGLHILVESNRE